MFKRVENDSSLGLLALVLIPVMIYGAIDELGWWTHLRGLADLKLLLQSLIWTAIVVYGFVYGMVGIHALMSIFPRRKKAR